MMQYEVQCFMIEKEQGKPVLCPEGWEPFYIEFRHGGGYMDTTWQLWAKRKIEDDARISRD